MSALLGSAMMKSLISSNLVLERTQAMGSQKDLMTARSRQMAKEIDIDKDRNINTKRKEETLEKVEEGISSLNEEIGSSLGELNGKIAEDSEKIREEEKIANEREDKKEEAKQAAKADPQDVVEISPEARAAQAAAQKNSKSNSDLKSERGTVADTRAAASAAVPKTDTAVHAPAPKVQAPVVNTAEVSTSGMDKRA